MTLCHSPTPLTARPSAQELPLMGWGSATEDASEGAGWAALAV